MDAATVGAISAQISTLTASIVARLPTAGQTARIKKIASGTITVAGIATTATATVTGATADNCELRNLGFRTDLTDATDYQTTLTYAQSGGNVVITATRTGTANGTVIVAYCLVEYAAVG